MMNIMYTYVCHLSQDIVGESYQQELCKHTISKIFIEEISK